jgi:hypothetical protein
MLIEYSLASKPKTLHLSHTITVKWERSADVKRIIKRF